jgi:hypothetical protein
MLLALPLLTLIEPALLVSMSAGLWLTANVCVGSVTLFLKAPPMPRPNPSSVPMKDPPEQRTRMTMNAIKQPNHGLLRLRGPAAGPA